MSPLAKVFVVINLVLAVGVLSINATLFSAREQFTRTIDTIKAEQTKNAEQHERAIALLRGALTEAKQNNNNLNSKNQLLEQKETQLNDQLATLQRELREAESKINEKDTLIAVKEQQLLQKDQQNSRLIQKNEELLASEADAQRRRTAAETARARAFLDRQQLEKELAETRNELVEVQEEYATAQAILTAAENQGLNLASIYVDTPPPPIDGTVVAVRPDADLVILSVGANDAVEEGHEFTVYRGSRFVAKVRVKRVTEDMAGAAILFTDSNIEVGDKATTRIGGLGG